MGFSDADCHALLIRNPRRAIGENK
jgi:hypothetical protein